MAELNTKQSATSTDTKRARRVRKMSPKVDLTAMVDLAFLLITFFMLTTSLNKPNTLDVALPDKSTDAPIELDENRIVNVLIHHNSYSIIHGNIANPIQVIEQVQPLSTHLKQKLVAINKVINTTTAGKNAIVLLKPTDEANTRDIITAFDEIKSSGIKQYMLSKLNTQERDIMLTKR